jgi:hypothetical protein
MSDGDVASGARAAPSTSPTDAAALDPLELLKSTSYIQLLVLAAFIGLPVSAVGYFFLTLVSHLQTWCFSSLPMSLRFYGTPA